MSRIPKKATKKHAYTVYRPQTLSHDIGKTAPTIARPSRRRSVHKRLTVARPLLVLSVASLWLMLLWVAHPHSTAPVTASLGEHTVAQALSRHPVRSLLGDYLQIHTVAQVYARPLRLRATSGCAILSNARPGLRQTKSYAYLYSGGSLSGGSTGCSLAQILKNQGRPTRTVTVAGIPPMLSQTLLFYDQPHRVKLVKQPVSIVPPTVVIAPPTLPGTPPVPVAAVVPLTLQTIGNTQCAGRTIMNVVAHQDDDLLFMNPDTIHDLQAGNCIRSVYLTAGDDGRGSYYWLQRQKGVEAAYSSMLGRHGGWLEQRVNLGNGQHITIASPNGSSRVSLIFMHLPDGNLDGSGFPASGFESLAKLQAGTIANITSLDGQSIYDSAGVVATLSNIMNTYHPVVIRTQADDGTIDIADHSDHIVTGRYAAAALVASMQAGVASLAYYQGYPIRGLPENVSPADVANKAAAFFAYAHYDNSVCRSMDECTATSSAYSMYVMRQYGP